MDGNSTGPRTAQQTSDSLKNRMNAYALAAGATGVSLLALAQPANAEIIFTPSNGTVPLEKAVLLDLNHDGTADVSFFRYSFAYHSFRSTLNVTPLNGGGIIAPEGHVYAAALFRGNSIGPTRSFGAARLIMERTDGFDISSSIYHREVVGLWSNKTNRYLGVKFIADGATHYGWVRLTVTDSHRPMKATISGYAYETVADQPIEAGQLSDEASAPAQSAPMAAPALGALALGSTGLQFWRREDALLPVQ